MANAIQMVSLYADYLKGVLKMATVSSINSIRPATPMQKANVTHAFRQFLIWYGIEQLLGLLLKLGGTAFSSSLGKNDPDALLLTLLGLGYMLVAGGGILVAVVMVLTWGYRLTAAIGSQAPAGWVIFLLFPVINLVALLIINNNALAWCKSQGIEVGLLGPSVATIERLREVSLSPPPPPPAPGEAPLGFH